MCRPFSTFDPVPHVGEPASGEQLHLAVELEVAGVDDGQATGLQHAEAKAPSGS